MYSKCDECECITQGALHTIAVQSKWLERHTLLINALTEYPQNYFDVISKLSLK